MATNLSYITAGGSKTNPATKTIANTNNYPGAIYYNENDGRAYQQVKNSDLWMPIGDGKTLAANTTASTPSPANGGTTTNNTGNSGVTRSTTTAAQQAAREAAREAARVEAEAAAEKQRQLAQYDRGISDAEAALGRVDESYNIARGNIDRQYGVQDAEINSAYAQNQNDYRNNVTRNSQQYITNKNAINDRASQGLRGLMRALGSMNALGGSGIQLGGQAVAEDATRERTGAGNVFGENQQNLDTNWNVYDTNIKNDRKKLDNWRNEAYNQAETARNENRINSLNALAELRGQRAAYTDGNAMAAATPYLDQIRGLQDANVRLQAINPTYTGATSVYNAPSIESYTMGENKGVQPQNAAEQAGGSYLDMLLGRNNGQDKRRFGY